MTLTWSDVTDAADRLADRWRDQMIGSVYGVPRGGIPPALMVASRLGVPIVDAPANGTLVVDDLVDSGATAARFNGRFDALYRKPHSPADVARHAVEVDGWLEFPWEAGETGPEDAVRRLLQWVGENPDRPGLRDTPRRVAASLRELTCGYRDDADHLAVVFPDTADQMVVLTGIEFTSLCEHHMLPFTGTATVGYIPAGDVVGLSKLARVVDVYARRLQVQERLTAQIADAVDDALHPEGVGVILDAHHACMGLRGVGKRDARMVTSALRGAMLDNPTARQEFLGFRDR